jgi:putative cardiolipin synthase
VRGGQATESLYQLINKAESETLIQSPYLIVPKSTIQLFKVLIEKGVGIKISTNSLASTDNLMAYSGYHNIRSELLAIEVALYEYKPSLANQQELHQRYLQMKSSPPIFAIHAKSMVIDKKIAAIGTFNVDPRSINLNTEVGVIIPDAVSALELHGLISDDIKPENSWHIDKDNNPDKLVSLKKRLNLCAYKMLPLEPVL